MPGRIKTDDVNASSPEVSDPELRFELDLPLPYEGVWHQHSYDRSRSIYQALTDDEPCLDRLPEPNFVGQEVPLHRVRENPSSDADLMRMQVNGR